MSFGICGLLTSCDRVLPFPGRPRSARRRRMKWFQTRRWEVAYTTYFEFRSEREFQETNHILLAQATIWARGSGITPLAAYRGICGHEHRAVHWQGAGEPSITWLQLSLMIFSVLPVPFSFCLGSRTLEASAAPALLPLAFMGTTEHIFTSSKYSWFANQTLDNQHRHREADYLLGTEQSGLVT